MDLVIIPGAVDIRISTGGECIIIENIARWIGWTVKEKDMTMSPARHQNPAAWTGIDGMLCAEPKKSPGTAGGLGAAGPA